MTEAELLDLLARGEDSRHQFKRAVTNADGLAAELIALANTAGGYLLVGVEDDGSVRGLAAGEVASLNQLLSNAASQNVRPPLNPITQNVRTAQGLVVVIEVSEGVNKPYVDTQGRIWVKSGADKRQVTAREELQRLFQQSGLVYADEVPVATATAEDLDTAAFAAYFEQRNRKPVEAAGVSLPRLLDNLSITRNGVPTLAGLLLFGKAPQLRKPAFVVKAVAFPGTVLHDTRYLDSEDLDGPLPEIYRRAMAFVNRNLRHVQAGQSFNSPGQLEVPEIVFEELLVNALVHRDYFISAPIRLLIFADRVEIISPGHLPDHLDTEQIRFGLSNLRNPALASHAFHMLPYRGLGSGIPRATEAWPHIELIDDRRANQFKAIVRRPKATSGPESGPESRPESGPESKPLAEQVVDALRPGPLGKSEVARALGHQSVSSGLNKAIRALLAEGRIEMTRPDTPQSRLQKYRLLPSVAEETDPPSEPGPLA